MEMPQSPSRGEAPSAPLRDSRCDHLAGGAAECHSRIPRARARRPRTWRSRRSSRSSTTSRGSSSPAGELCAGGRLSDRPRRADARRQRAHESGDIRDDVDGGAGAEAHDRVLRQEHDRQGRVSADGGARDALRQHPQPALERPRRRTGHGLLDDRLQRGRDARRPGPQAPLAEAAGSGGPARRQAEPRDGHQRPGLLGEVRQLLGRRDAPRPDGGRSLQPVRRGGRRPLRREHHRRRRHPGLDVRRLVRADRGDLRSARRVPGGDRHRRPGARRRCLRRVHRAVHRSRPGVGLPAAARGLDQRLGSQVRPRVARRRLDHLARRRGAARGPHLLGQLPRRQHADVRAQLLAPGRADRRAVLQLPAPRLRRLRQGAGLRARGRHAAVGRRSRSSARSSS